MFFVFRRRSVAFLLVSICLIGGSAHGQSLKIQQRKANPYSSPRPAAQQVNVPLKTGYFIEILPDEKNTADAILSNTITVSLETHDDSPATIYGPDGIFAPGYSGTAKGSTGIFDASGVWRLNIESEKELPAATTCTLRVSAQSAQGKEISPQTNSWWFVTQPAPAASEIASTLDFAKPALKWSGGFFTGICWGGVIPEMAEGYQKIADVRKKFPKSWNLHRTSTLAGFEFQTGFSPARLPNIVRERETRRIKAIKQEDQGSRLLVEDFIGHEQYGIDSDRPVSADYHEGDEVLIADGVNSTRTLVISADDATKSVLVKSFPAPAEGWKIEYAQNAPTAKELGIPGVFPAGGCYLRKFNPVGTPHYYWGRMDQEWDIMWKKYGRRPIPGFDQGPGDLSIDGGPYNTVKDYAQYHDVVRTITSHAIERYGEDCLKFYWSVFNEPDLFTSYWRSRDWIELQKFYDYTVDAILRAFEDHGMDSKKVMVGGLELGAIFGTNMRTREFLYHCSPTTAVMQDSFVTNMVRKSTLLYNAAFADERLYGKRSRRVEELCAANDGRGAPCDFLSVHCYGGAKLSADKMIIAKDTALEIDPEHFKNLYICTHEACPDWAPPADNAARDSYLGNGYFETWCADIAHRLLSKADVDRRYAFGESILTFWGFPMSGFNGLNAATHSLSIDKNGDGIGDQKETVLMPIVNYLALMCSIGPDYWVIPAQTMNGHRAGGFASRDDKEIRMLLYSHNEGDPQSISANKFNFSLALRGTGWEKVKVSEMRFDTQHNTFYETARTLRDRKPLSTDNIKKADPKKIASLMQAIQTGKPDAQMKALKQFEKLGIAAADSLPSLMMLNYTVIKDKEVKAAAGRAMESINPQKSSYTPKELEPIYRAQKIRTTSAYDVSADESGSLPISAEIPSNGSLFLVLAR